jgi:hypothetical protein
MYLVKKNPSQIQDHAFKIFPVTFKIKHTVDNPLSLFQFILGLKQVYIRFNALNDRSEVTILQRTV